MSDPQVFSSCNNPQGFMEAVCADADPRFENLEVESLRGYTQRLEGLIQYAYHRITFDQEVLGQCDCDAADMVCAYCASKHFNSQVKEFGLDKDHIV